MAVDIKYVHSEMRREMETLRRRIRILENALTQQAARITALRESMDHMQTAPAIRWWDSQEQADIRRQATEAAGK